MVCTPRLGRKASVFVALATLAAGGFLASAAQAANSLTWNGAGTTWSPPTDWNPNTTPSTTPGSPDDLIFSGTVNRGMTNDLTGVQVHSMTNGTGGWTLTGNTVTIDGLGAIISSTATGSGAGFTHSEVLTLNVNTEISVTSTLRIDFGADINGVGGITKTGTGTTRWSSAKSYAGDTTISVGTLSLTADAIPNGAGKGNLSIASGAVVQSENVSMTINGLNGGGTIQRPAASQTSGHNLTIGNNDANGTFTGTINFSGGNSSVIKTGVGTQTLNSVTVSSSGGVSANGGKLFITGPVSAGNTTVAANATLGGTATYTLAAAFTANGIVAPGTQGVGAMNVSATTATLSATSTLAIEIGGSTAGTGYDQLNFTNTAGTVTLDPAAALSLSLVNSYTPTASDVDYILTRADAGTFASTFAGTTEGSTVNLGAYTAQITYQANWSGTQAGSSLTGGNDIALFNFQPASAPVPEPASLGVLTLGAVALLTRRRK